MIQLSIGPVLDAGIILTAFLIRTGLYHGALKLMCRGEMHLSILRSLVVSALVAMTTLYGVSAAIPYLPEWALENLSILTMVMLIPGTILLTRMVCEVAWWKALVGAAILIALTGASDRYAPVLAARVMPEGSVSFADYRQQAEMAVAAARQQAARVAAESEESVGTLRRSLDAIATLTRVQEQVALREDFERGVDFWAERKRLMDDMTPEEIREYREAMAAFLQEQGIDSDRYSMARLAQISSDDVAALAGLLSDVKRMEGQNRGGSDQQAVRSITESLATIAANLSHASFSGEDMDRMKAFTSMFSRGELEEAVANVKREFEEAGGSDAMALTLLRALNHLEKAEQAGVDLSLLGSLIDGLGANAAAQDGQEHRGGDSPFDPSYLVGLLGRDGVAALVNANGLLDLLDPRELQAILESTTDVVSTLPPAGPELPQYVVVEFSLGTLIVPASIERVTPYVVAASQMNIEGYATIGNRTAVLLKDGTILRPGQPWRSRHKDDQYIFVLGGVEKGRIVLHVPVPLTPVEGPAAAIGSTSRGTGARSSGVPSETTSGRRRG